MCIVRDVSEREAAVEALRASEASARAFVENSPYGICRVAPDGRFLAVNPALAHMLGYPDADALLGVDLGELYVDPAARAEVLRRHAAGETVVAGVETVWRRRDGSALPVRLHSREVRGDDGAVAYYEAFVKDMAALRSAEQALRQAERLAAVGRFVSGVAHELNNPLAAVLLFADGLLDDAARPAADREAITLIREQSLRARAIVRDLLAFVRGAGGAPATVEARDVLAAAARALAPQAAAEGGRLEVAFGPDLGWLRVDRAGVEQVVTNLVVNAMHAAPGGRVRLAADRAGDVLRVTVDDEGPGIPPEVQARMFEPFFTTKPVGAGTGLGLSVSLGIVERYGGTLAGDNRAPGEVPGMGAGARFTLTLPLAAAPGTRGADVTPALGTARAVMPPAAALPPAARPAAAHPVDGPEPTAGAGEPPTGAPAGGANGAGVHGAGANGPNGPDGAGGADHAGPAADPAAGDGAAGPPPRLLVVDDEASIRQALVRFFGRRGWAVDEADDGRAAFARLLDAEAAGAPYDLVLSDVRMPDVSGVALHDWLARTRPALLDRVVFATGDDASAESAAFVRRTRCRVLEKPFDADTLTALARRPDDGAAAGADRPADAGRA
jgi:PAS domain S-box-containing protein